MFGSGGMGFQKKKSQFPRSSVCSLYTVKERDGLLHRVEKRGGVITYR